MTPEDFIHDRKDRGLSQQGQADLLDVGVDVVRSLETGRELRPANALKVATFYGKRITEIWPVDRKEAA